MSEVTWIAVSRSSSRATNAAVRYERAHVLGMCTTQCSAHSAPPAGGEGIHGPRFAASMTR
jgi:hypothetical protein